ncbi:MAG: IS3 family transposase, partial [Gallionella sp.]|nr:IS3 family transposase [Gallionella sp.]
MNTGERRSQRDYTLAFKLSVVEQVEKGEMSYKQAQLRYGIQGRSTVLVWLRKHGRMDWRNLSPTSRKDVQMSDRQLPQTPDQRIKELEVQLREANEKARLFEAMLDVIKNEYGLKIPKKAFRQVIEQSQVEGLSISAACRHYGMSRQAYYQQLSSTQAKLERNEVVVSLVEQRRLRQPRIGTRKLHYLLSESFAERGIKLGRDGLFDLLRDARLLVPTKRAYHKTTDSHHRFRKHPDLLKDGPQQVLATRPEEVWVADITYIPTREKFAYLSLVTDAYSRRIMGYHVHGGLQTEGVGRALKMAIRGRKTRAKLIHHSDRGIQYCSSYYQQLHEKHEITCSMTDGYDCYQNALAERVNGILKNEFLLQIPKNLREATQMIKESIHIYNHERPHLA